MRSPSRSASAQPLEHHHADALADQESVGAPVERPDPLLRDSAPSWREHAPERGVVAEVHAAREHESQRPDASSRHAWSTATSELAHAASTV